MNQIRSSFFQLTFLLALTAAPATTTSAADWPGWRGADRNDHSPDTGLLKRWSSKGPKQVWLFEDAGLGYSGPAIVGGKLYTLGIREEVIDVDL